jgi:hypothetical protein
MVIVFITDEEQTHSFLHPRTTFSLIQMSSSALYSRIPWPVIFPSAERPSFTHTSEKRQFAYWVTTWPFRPLEPLVIAGGRISFSIILRVQNLNSVAILWPSNFKSYSYARQVAITAAKKICHYEPLERHPCFGLYCISLHQ